MEIAVKVWYQVCNLSTHTVFGFSSKDGIVIDCNNRAWIGKSLQQIKTELINCQVTKIAEQCLT